MPNQIVVCPQGVLTVQGHTRKITRTKRELDHGIFPFIGWINQKISGAALASEHKNNEKSFCFSN